MKRKIILLISILLIGSATAMGVYAATGQAGRQNGNRSGYSINRGNGQHADGEREHRNAGNGNGGQGRNVNVRPSEARSLVLSKFKGYSIKDFERDREDGKESYEIEITNGKETKEVKVNAETGEITEIENH